MPNPSTMTKPCVICGEDCAGKPRVKDKLGRYFHEHCYEKALAQKKNAQQPDSDARPAPRPNPAAHVTHPPAIELNTQADPDLLAELLESGGAPQAGSPLHNCPECGKRLGDNATLCTNCGFNLTQGGRLKTEKGEVTVLPHQALRADEDDPTRLKPILDEAIESTAFTGYTPPTVKAAKRNTVWPYVFGGLCAVIGLGMTLLCGFLTFTTGVAAFSDGSTVVLVFLAGSLISLLFGIWQLWCGIGLLQRNASAAVQLKRWAVLQTLLFGSCIGLVLFATFALDDGTASRTPDQFAELGMQVLRVILALMLVVMVGWPVTCWIWITRPSIIREIKQW